MAKLKSFGARSQFKINIWSGGDQLTRTLRPNHRAVVGAASYMNQATLSHLIDMRTILGEIVDFRV